MERKDKGFLKTDNDLLEELGVASAVIYGIIRETYQFWQSKGELIDGYCYLTEPTIQKRTKLGQRAQKAAVKELELHGLIKRKVCGMPRRQYFKLLNSSQSLQMQSQVTANDVTSNCKSSDKELQMQSQVTANVCLSKTRDKTREIILDDKTREERGNFYRYLQNYGMLSAWDIDKLNDSINKYGIEWCKEAFEVAKLRGHTKWSYADGIVNNWGYKYGKADKPWELERAERKSSSYNRNSTRKNDGSDVDWENEPDEFV